ncbi:MAG: methylmalonyl-CoA mutase family protein [Bacteroidota bacterium]
MIGLKQSFPEVSIEKWKERLKKDLKADDLSALHFEDEAENLSLEAYSFAGQSSNDNVFVRGFNKTSNDWKNGCTIKVTNEKSANQKALQVLNQGADALIFELQAGIDFTALLENIALEYIHTTFLAPSDTQVIEILKNPSFNYENCAIGVDLFSDGTPKELNAEMLAQLHSKQMRCLLVDGFSLQQCGANAIEELSFSLATANEYLHLLVEKGLTIDEASACIHFRIGVGANYFQQIAKIRALKSLWTTLVSAYEPVHRCSYNTKIWAQTGLLNKSAKDPYTNLLRQTSEAMSATIAGVEMISIQPFSDQTTSNSAMLSERMALNISLILKEESYLDKVIDPLGGSFAIENLTNQIIEKVWSEFQKIENLGGIGTSEAQGKLRSSVEKTAKLRIVQFESKQKTLIGVNKFQLPENSEMQFEIHQDYFGLPFINLENELRNEKN